MISLPRGVADCLAPHPDMEIEPARSSRSGPVLFSVISESAGGGGSRRVR